MIRSRRRVGGVKISCFGYRIWFSLGFFVNVIPLFFVSTNYLSVLFSYVNEKLLNFGGHFVPH
jgi:hypothetical protein